MRLLYLPIIPLLCLAKYAMPGDPIDKVAEIIGKGNVHEVAKLFAPNIELTLMDDANTYSKVQAELILQKFFTENKPINSKMLHKIISSASYHFGVVIVNTDKGPYRVAFTLKETDGNTQLIELRIESEKVK